MSNITDWNVVSKDEIRNLGDVPFYPEESDVEYRISPIEKRKLYNVYENYSTLIKKMSDYCQTKCKEARSPYNPLLYAATECDFSESYMRKMIKQEKRVTRKALGQFCVGLGLSIKESEELFALTGKNLVFGYTYFDSITMCAIRDRDNIEDYLNELEEYKDRIIE